LILTRTSLDDHVGVRMIEQLDIRMCGSSRETCIWEMPPDVAGISPAAEDH